MIQPVRRLLPALSFLALFAACRDRAGTDVNASADSSFAHDLAMAQRQAPPQTVFNDAPIGGTTNAATTPNAPAPKREPSRARAPRPTPRREEPPAPVSRTPRPTTPAPVATAPAPAPGPAAGRIGAGSAVGMKIDGRVCTISALAGDKFTATVTSTTVGTNGATIRAGTTVVLEVSSVERTDPPENSRIHFHVRAIDVNGESYPADGEVATLSTMETSRVSTGNDKTKVVGGAIAGAVLGRILGGGAKGTVIGAAAGAAAGTAAARRSQTSNACLPEGSSLQLTLSRDIVVRRDGPI